VTEDEVSPPAEFEFRFSGFPPIGLFVSGFGGLCLLATIFFGSLASNVTSLITRAGSVGGWVIVLGWVVFLAALAGAWIVTWRARRYVIDADRVRVTGGLFREHVDGQLARRGAASIELRKNDVALRDTRGGELVLHGAGRFAFEALTKAWPEVKAVPDARAPRGWLRTVLRIALFFLPSALPAALVVVPSKIARAQLDACVDRVRTEVEAAAAATSDELVKRESAKGREAVPYTSHRSLAHISRIAFVETTSWDLDTRIHIARGDEDERRVSVRTTVDQPWALFSRSIEVWIEPDGEADDDLFVAELSKRLDAKGIAYTVKKRP
jgi:hypothetical protein